MSNRDDDYTLMTDDNDIDEILDERSLSRDDDESWGPNLSRINYDDDEDEAFAM